MSLITNFTQRVNDAYSAGNLATPLANFQAFILKNNLKKMVVNSLFSTVIIANSTVIIAKNVVLFSQLETISSPELIAVTGIITFGTGVALFATVKSVNNFLNSPRNQIQLAQLANDREDFCEDFKAALDDIKRNIKVISNVKNAKSTISPDDKKYV